MQALVVVNPRATRTSPRTRDVLVSALVADHDVEVVETTGPGQARSLGLQAAAEKVDLVITLGGDGTVNETVNGMLDAGPSPDGPMLACVPGGSTNVFARALGLPADPVEATGQLLEALRAGRRRTVGLATANGQWFTFCAGFGLDAEVVADVEARRSEGAPLSGRLYLRTAVHRFARATDRRNPPITVTAPGAEPVEGVFVAIVQNTAPWTYLRSRAVQACPDASFDTGVDVLALRRLTTLSTLYHAGQLIVGDGARGSDVVTVHDAAEMTLWADRPTAFQLDGEPLGERVSVRVVSHPAALTVVV